MCDTVIAKIKVDGVTAVATELSQIPKGIQGATIEVTYDGAWGSLKKTAVFSGSVVKDVVNAGAVISVPPETVAKSGHRLRVGFYGVDGENKVIMPTLWVDLGAIQSAADPSGDTSTNQSLPVWAQLQAEFEALKEAGGIKGEKGDKGDPGPAGPQGEQGPQGDSGKDYVITDDDYAEIAGMAAELVEVPEAPEVSMKPLTFTGAVNATYDGSEAVSVEIPQGGGGSADWIKETITLKEAVSKISFSPPAGTKEVFIKASLGGNKEDMSLTTGTGKFIISVNGKSCGYETLNYKESGTYPSYHIFEKLGTRLRVMNTGVFNTPAWSQSQSLKIQCDKSTMQDNSETINLIEFNPETANYVFLIGSTLEVWYR